MSFPAQTTHCVSRRDERAADAVRALALRMVPAGQKGLDIKLLSRLLASSSAALRLEAIRTLGETTFPEAAGLLRAVATDEKAPPLWRLEAIAGLAGFSSGTTKIRRRSPPCAECWLVRSANPDRRPALLAERVGDSDVRNDRRHLPTRWPGGPRATRRGTRSIDSALSFRLSGRELPQSLSTRATRRPVSTEDWLAWPLPAAMGKTENACSSIPTRAGVFIVTP